MMRADSERIRARAKVRTLRAMLDAVALVIDDEKWPPGHEAAQAITSAAVDIAVMLAKIDAYMRAEADAAAAGKETAT